MNQIKYLKGKRLIDGNKKYILINNFKLSLISLGWLLSGIFICIIFYNLNLNLTKTSISSEEVNYLDCNNKSFVDTVYCVNDYINSIYNFTLREDTIKTLDDIKLNGGDCFDWSNLFVDIMKELNFTGQTIDLLPFNNTGHSLALLQDKQMKHYCITSNNEIVGCSGLK